MSSPTGTGDSRRTLILLRHAKSDYPSGVPDHGRPLAARGVREAALAGDWLRATLPAPVDAVLCSTANRTRQTLQRTGIAAPVHYLDSIYDSTPGIVIDEIHLVQSRFAAEVTTLLVVGHEPVMSWLALNLADDASSSSAVAQDIAAKFPTSAMALLRTAAPWDRLTPGGAELVDFHIAR
ncbi:MAG: histidine phosphatase family protein [Mycolicibacterium sp.]|uniref:SixA phosphatase family protein n=1 Tax=Mycolicibacterium sp. TaxID=2320850 RepID=UPI003D097582